MCFFLRNQDRFVSDFWVESFHFMDSITKAQSLLFLAVFSFVPIQIHVVYAQKFDSLTQKVTFYPGSLLISHSPKPLTFYEDTKLLNVHTVFNFF